MPNGGLAFALRDHLRVGAERRLGEDQHEQMVGEVADVQEKEPQRLSLHLCLHPVLSPAHEPVEPQCSIFGWAAQARRDDHPAVRLPRPRPLPPRPAGDARPRYARRLRLEGNHPRPGVMRTGVNGHHRDVRYWGQSGHCGQPSECLLIAMSGSSQCRRKKPSTACSLRQRRRTVPYCGCAAGTTRSYVTNHLLGFF